MTLLELEIRLEQELLIICVIAPSARIVEKEKEEFTGQLNDERYVEYLLQPLREDERNHVAEMHRVARGSSSGVEVERVSSFVSIQNQVEFPVAPSSAAIQPMGNVGTDR